MLHYRTHGSPSQPPLCFLHGFMGSADDWGPIVNALEREAYCLTVDLPGHGQSLDCDPHLYSMEGVTQGLADVLDEVGIDRCSLVGYSMGGRVALYFTLFHPNRVRRLGLESTSPGLSGEEERSQRRCVDDRRAARIQRDLEAFLSNWYRQPLFASLDRHDLVEEMVITRQANDSDELARALRGLGTGQQPSLWERLSDLRMPVLLLTGALDEKYEGITKRAVSSIRNAKRVVVPRAGHNVHAERPQAFLAQLVHFLKHT